jgi:hypothetical protein
MHTGVWWEDLRESDHLEDLSVEGATAYLIPYMVTHLDGFMTATLNSNRLRQNHGYKTGQRLRPNLGIKQNKHTHVLRYESLATV